jgi:hypothetical protein
MVQSFIPAVNLEDNRGCQISTVVLTNLFNAVQYVITNLKLKKKLFFFE